jgi:diguanylate cyclase (GGDEF)-like protein/PAS domain S-box-containing protein
MLQPVKMSASVDSARARHADRRYGRMTVLPDEPAEPFVRQLARRFGWLRRNALLMLALAAVIGSLIATVAVVRNGATAKDRLRQAQIALVQVPAALFATVQSPQALLSGEPAAPSEFPLSESLRDRLATLTVTVARFWSTPLTHTIRREARQVKSSTAQLMSMIADHRLRRANQIFDRRINPLATVLDKDVSTAAKSLTREIARDDRSSWILTIVVVGFAGALLLALVSAVALARRRQERTRIKRARIEVEANALRGDLERLQAMVEHGSDIITVVRSDATVVFQVGAVEAILGYAVHMPEGANLIDWVAAADQPVLLALCRTAHAAREELRMLHADGMTVTTEVSATLLVDHPVWRDVVVLNMWDVSRRKLLEERLRHQAFHDQLTQLPNRALVLDYAERMLSRATRQNISMTALYIDLDGFKSVNDTLGHAAGDEVLRTVGARLSRLTRPSDLVGRLGGDEFIMLVDGLTLDVTPETVAERVLAALREPLVLTSADELSLCVSASLGIATAQGGTADQVLRDADLALYEAKDAGKGRYVVSSRPPQAMAVEVQAGSVDREP